MIILGGERRCCSEAENDGLAVFCKFIKFITFSASRLQYSLYFEASKQYPKSINNYNYCSFPPPFAFNPLRTLTDHIFNRQKTWMNESKSLFVLLPLHFLLPALRIQKKNRSFGLGLLIFSIPTHIFSQFYQLPHLSFATCCTFLNDTWDKEQTSPTRNSKYVSNCTFCNDSLFRSWENNTQTHKKYLFYHSNAIAATIPSSTKCIKTHFSPTWLWCSGCHPCHFLKRTATKMSNPCERSNKKENNQTTGALQCNAHIHDFTMTYTKHNTPIDEREGYKIQCTRALPWHFRNGAHQTRGCR